MYCFSCGNETVESASFCAACGAKVIRPEPEASKISGLDETYGDGDHFSFAGRRVDVIHTPGHTLGHVCYHMPGEKLLFAADTLFALGCGRLFEGTPKDMWTSLQKLMKLPDDTTVYCGHEYTLANARFAMSVDPDNAALQDYAREIDARRSSGEPTVPTVLERELATNPFLRADAPEMRERWGGETPADTFAKLRAAKDSF